MTARSPRWLALVCLFAITWTACSDNDNGEDAAPAPDDRCDHVQAAADDVDESGCDPVDVADLDGGDLYGRYCASCHQADGSGIEGIFPALAKNPFVTAEDPTGAIATILNGRGGMPRWGDELSDAQIAAILSYLRSSLGENDAGNVTDEKVAEVREEQGTHAADH